LQFICGRDRDFGGARFSGKHTDFGEAIFSGKLAWFENPQAWNNVTFDWDEKPAHMLPECIRPRDWPPTQLLPDSHIHRIEVGYRPSCKVRQILLPRIGHVCNDFSEVTYPTTQGT
jgi:hypothetical protein